MGTLPQRLMNEYYSEISYLRQNRSEVEKIIEDIADKDSILHMGWVQSLKPNGSEGEYLQMHSSALVYHILENELKEGETLPRADPSIHGDLQMRMNDGFVSVHNRIMRTDQNLYYHLVDIAQVARGPYESGHLLRRAVFTYHWLEESMIKRMTETVRD